MPETDQTHQKLNEKAGGHPKIALPKTISSKHLPPTPETSKTPSDRKTDRTVIEDIGGTLRSVIHPRSRQPYYLMLTSDCLSPLAQQELWKVDAGSSQVETAGRLPAFFDHRVPGAFLAAGEDSPPLYPREDDLFSLFFPKHQISTWFTGFLAL